MFIEGRFEHTKEDPSIHPDSQGFVCDFLPVPMDYLVFKRPWVGLLVFFCIAMVPSESGDAFTASMRLQPASMIRMAQVTMMKGNILQTMVKKAMKNGDNSKMIKGIKGLKIKALSIPKTELMLDPKDKFHTVVTINITVAGKSFIGGHMQITVVGELKIYAQISVCSKGKIVLLVIYCKVKVLSCKTNLPSSMLPKIVNKFLDSTLGKVMPGVLCPAADMLMEQQIEAFDIILEKKRIGNCGYLLFEVSEKPVVHDFHIHINIKIKIQKNNGEILKFDYDQLPNDLPPCKDKMSVIFLPKNILDAFMDLMHPHFNTHLTKVKGSVPTSDHLKKILPKAGLPAGKKLKVKIHHSKCPKFTVSSSARHITTSTEASFLDATKGNQIFSIKMKHECRTTFEIKHEHLVFSLKQGACRTVEVSSPAGNVTGASQYTETVMDSWMLHATDILNMNRIPLPSLMNVTNTTTDPELIFHENMLIIQSEIQPYGKEEMAEQMKEQCNTIKL